MKSPRYIVLQYLLALSLLILPVQSAWSMASMASCKMMDQNSETLMVDCKHHAAQLTLSSSDASNSMDTNCDGNSCNICPQLSFFVDVIDALAVSTVDRLDIPFKNKLNSFQVLLDSPPPIIS